LRKISFDIENFIDNDPVLLLIFFSLSLFASIIKIAFSDNKKNIKVGQTLLKIILTALVSALVVFSSLEIIRNYIKGNLLYLFVFFFGFVCDILIKQLVKIKNISGLIKLIDDIYTFIKNRRN